ncbi:hypothetical protein EZV62_001803 [Acer yangbiense]|uniref:CCHC-type domain-containing protein n=1 Tax=Acer yangbiense TaxID=1000413 RepID=A0A5C7IWH0_9ROSI|nr:hypothetical protein EZV62_001803 [Acer yangbiense]
MTSPRSLSFDLHHLPLPPMEARRRSTSKQSQLHSNKAIHSSTVAATPSKASEALPLPLYITNAVVYHLLWWWLVFSHLGYVLAMSAQDLSQLCENLSLVDEDEVVLEITEDATLDGVKDVDLCLVGKGSGNISHLDFNKAEFWIQIHEIPILCMNRRTAKWMAEQIGEVVEIPADSRECWGKLQEFCFACGRVGHGIMECLDVEARKLALEGATTKWKSNEGSKEGEGDGSISVKPGSLVSLKAVSGSEVASPTGIVVGTLALDGGLGTKEDEMCMDGPRNGPHIPTKTVGLQSKTISNAASPSPNGEQISPNPNLIEPTNIIPSPKTNTTNPSVPQHTKDHSNGTPPSSQPEPQNKVRKWKKNARENKHQLKPGIATSPFHRLLEISKSPVKHQKSKVSSPLALKKGSSQKKGKSPQKCRTLVSSLPNIKKSELSTSSGSELKVCKRKVSFQPLIDEVRETKTDRMENSCMEIVISAEPVDQACRD